MEIKEMREVKVRYCDLCYEATGEKVEVSGLYSTCDVCHKDMCPKHRSVWGGEEDSCCVKCEHKPGR